MFAASSDRDPPSTSRAPSRRHGAKGRAQGRCAVEEPPAFAAASSRDAPLDGGARGEAGRRMRGVQRARQRERTRSHDASLPRHRPAVRRLRAEGSAAARGPWQRCRQESQSSQSQTRRAEPQAGAGASSIEHRSAPLLASIPQQRVGQPAAEPARGGNAVEIPSGQAQRDDRRPPSSGHHPCNAT